MKNLIKEIQLSAEIVGKNNILNDVFHYCRFIFARLKKIQKLKKKEKKLLQQPSKAADFSLSANQSRGNPFHPISAWGDQARPKIKFRVTDENWPLLGVSSFSLFMSLC